MRPCRCPNELSLMELPRCRGPRNIQFLKYLIHSTRSEITFISVTRSNKTRAEDLLMEIGSFNKLIVSLEEMSGDIWLLWEVGINLTILEVSKHYIFARIASLHGEDGLVRCHIWEC
jgi:hypothetical protein